MMGNYLREEAQSVQPLLALTTKWLFTFTKKHLIFKRVLQGGIPTVTLVISELLCSGRGQRDIPIPQHMPPTGDELVYIVVPSEKL
ncbi:hypothetical protein Peur_030515 [Populus x canadensis]